MLLIVPLVATVLALDAKWKAPAHKGRGFFVWHIPFSTGRLSRTVRECQGGRWATAPPTITGRRENFNHRRYSCNFRNRD